MPIDAFDAYSTLTVSEWMLVESARAKQMMADFWSEAAQQELFSSSDDYDAWKASYAPAAGADVSALVTSLTKTYNDVLDGPETYGRQRTSTERLVNVAAPLLHSYREIARAGISALPPSMIEDGDGLVDGLCEGLRRRVLQCVMKSLVLELHAAKLEGRLTGQSPQARFDSYANSVGTRGFRERFFSTYPVLIRDLHFILQHYGSATTELLDRLARDLPAIRRGLLPDMGAIARIDFGAGDQHGEGRSVAVLSDSGGAALVYKPRPLQIEQAWNRLMAWVNAQLPEERHFGTASVLDMGEYGWASFVRQHACRDPSGGERFFWRHGGLLAIFWMLSATDFHHENIIANGDTPVPIDLESLFHPMLLSDRAEDLILGPAKDSLLRIGLLPIPRTVDESGDPYDVSGMGGRAGQMSPEVPMLVDAGADGMRVETRRVATRGSNNSPILEGSLLRPVDYASEIEAGFRTLSRICIEARDELLRASGVLDGFRNVETRVIFRPTRVYGMAMDDLHHPTLSGTMLRRELHLARLWPSGEEFRRLVGIAVKEREDLLGGDVPRFISRPGSREVFCSGGLARMTMSAVPLEVAEVRLRGWTDQLVEQQCWTIGAALATLTKAEGEEVARLGPSASLVPSPDVPGCGEIPDVEGKLSEAMRLAHGIADLSLEGRCGSGRWWMGLTPVRGGRWAVGPVDNSLYHGVPGIALTLGFLGLLGGDERLVGVADEAFDSVIALFRAASHEAIARWGCGLFDGIGGLVYACVLWGRARGRSDLTGHALGMTYGPLRNGVRVDERYDLVSGSAGALMAALVAYDATSDRMALEVAVEAGERLVECAVPFGQGLGWEISPEYSRPLTGMSHGAAGIGLALARLGDTVGDARFTNCARRALQYERSCFLEQQDNWPDFRDDAGRPMTAWCHGAPGIALSRLRIGELASWEDQGETQRELEAALRTTSRQSSIGNHSLCHGDMGNTLVVCEAGSVHPEWASAGRAMLSDLWYRRSSLGSWRAATPAGFPSPGLMTGMAGIAFGLARIARPGLMPSVLDGGGPVPVSGGDSY